MLGLKSSSQNISVVWSAKSPILPFYSEFDMEFNQTEQYFQIQIQLYIFFEYQFYVIFLR